MEKESNFLRTGIKKNFIRIRITICNENIGKYYNVYN